MDKLEIKVVKAHSPKWGDEDKTAVNVMATFSHLDMEVPFTISPACKTEYSQEMWAAVNAGEYGEIAPYEGPSKLVMAEIYFNHTKKVRLQKIESQITILERAKRLELITPAELKELTRLERESVMVSRSEFKV